MPLTAGYREKPMARLRGNESCSAAGKEHKENGVETCLIWT